VSLLILYVTEVHDGQCCLIYRDLQALKTRFQIFPLFPTHDGLVLNVGVTTVTFKVNTNHLFYICSNCPFSVAFD
jgi:hypothetical protein